MIHQPQRQTDRQTEWNDANVTQQTDGQTTCDRKTVLGTMVLRAVKTTFVVTFTVV